MKLCWWLSLQHDWYDGFREGEKVWVSAHHSREKTVHSYLTASGSTDDLFVSNLASEGRLRVSHTDSGCSTTFLAPSDLHKITPLHNPTSLAITSAGALAAVADGKDILVFESGSGIVRRKLTGHLADVEIVRFFPSDRVLLTGGSDMCLRIWSVEDGSCPVTIPAHKRPITGLAMIDRGKEIISASSDGSIKVWRCGDQECLETISPGLGAINDISLFQGSSTTAEEEGRQLCSVSSNGTLSIHPVQQQTAGPSLHYSHPCELTTCSTTSDNNLVAGSVEGEVLSLDTRNLSQPVSSFKRSNYSVSNIARDPANPRNVWCSQRDGECYLFDSSSSDPLPELSLSGGDCEPILGLAVSEGMVLTSAKDRVIRRYKVA